MKRTLFFLCLIAVAGLVVAGGGQKFGEHLYVGHVIDQTGDTAKIVSLGPSTGLDSFLYLDTIAIYTATDSTAVAVTYQAHPLVRRILVGATIDTTHIDTVIFDLGTNTDTIAWTVPNIAGLVGAGARAVYIDSIVARINGLTETKDTILAQDSVTYIKCISKIAQIGCEGDARWTILYGAASAANNNMSAGTTDSTSIAQVVDSLVYKINNTATVKDTVTAADSATLVYLTGRAGYRFRFNGGDTTQAGDTTVVQEAAASTSQDDTAIYTGINMAERGYKNLLGNVVLYGSAATTKGYGTSDSVCFQLLRQTDTAGVWSVLAGDSGAIPRRWHIAYSNKDTLFGYGPLKITVRMFDTATDTSGTRYHTLDWDLTAWE